MTHMPNPAWSILGNRRKVNLTRCSSSNEALTTNIYYSCYDSHAQSCLVYFRKPEEDESCATSFDVPHQRLRRVMPVHVVSIFRYGRKMKVMRPSLMFLIKGCEASCPSMSYLFLDTGGRVRESSVNCGWWCHLPWACSCLPVCVLFL